MTATTCTGCSTRAPGVVVAFLELRKGDAPGVKAFREGSRITWTRGTDGELWCAKCVAIPRMDDSDNSLSEAHRRVAR